MEINPISGGLTLNGNINNGGYWIDVWGNNGKTAGLYGVLSGAGGVAVKQNSTVILSNNNTFTGGFWVEKGTLRLQEHTNAMGSGIANVGTNATLDLNYGAVNLTPAALVLFNGNVTKSVALATYWRGAFTNYNSSTVTVSSGNLYIYGGMNLVSGTLLFNNANAGGMNGGTMTGAGALTKKGAGNFNLYPGTHSGNINLDVGEIRQYTGTMGGGGTLTMSNGTTYRVDGTTARTMAKSSQINGHVTLGHANGAAVTFSNAMSLNSGVRTITCPNTNTISGVISSGGLNKDGVGMLILSAQNTHDSATIVSNGILRSAHQYGLGWINGDTEVRSGAALELSGGFTVSADESLILAGTGISSGGALRNISGNNIWGGAITLTAATRINSDSGTLQLGATADMSGAGLGLTVGGAGVVDIWGDLPTGAATYTKDGTGTNTLNNSSATRTWTGVTTISAGMLQVTGVNGLSSNSAVTVSSGATLDLSAGTAVGSIAGAGALSGGGALIAGGNNSDTTFTGVMSGGGALTKVGTGTLTLSGSTSTRSGNTTVSVGTLLQNGTNANSVVTVSSGAFLYGGGQVGETYIYGRVSAGTASNAVGTLKTGWLRLENNGILQVDMSAMDGTAGTDWDVLTSSGAIVVNAADGNDFIIALKGNPGDFVNTQGWTNTIVTSGNLTSFATNKFTVNTTEFTPSLGSGTFVVNQDGNNIRIIFELPASATPNISILGTNTALTIADGDVTPTQTDGTDFGSVAVDGITKTHTFTVTNSGTGPLRIDPVAIAGTHASDFSVTEQTYLYTTNYLRNAGYEIGPAGGATPDNWWHNNDCGQETWAARSGTNGYAWKSWNNGSWGLFLQDVTISLGVSDVVTFSIWVNCEANYTSSTRQAYINLEFWTNSGNWAHTVEYNIYDQLVGNRDSWQQITLSATCAAANITLLKPVVGFGGTTNLGLGSNSVKWDDASLTHRVMPAGSTTTFQITFDPSAAGTRSATVYLTNNVTGDKSTYSFALQGTGVPPDIAVLGTNFALIADGDTTPTQVDGTDFGGVAVNGGTKLHTFMITNPGPSVLRVENVTIGGAHASDFSVTAQPFSVIAYNLIATNPSFEQGTTAWSISPNADLRQEFYGMYAEHGTNFMRAWWESISYMDIPVSVGSTYVLSAWVATPAGSVETMSNEVYGLLTRDWLDAGKGYLSAPEKTFGTGTTYNVQITTGVWQHIAMTSAAPASAAYLRAGFGMWHGAAGHGGALFDEVVAYQHPGANGTSTFSVVFDPTAVGTRTATVYITNNVPGDEGEYTFVVQGTGTWAGISNSPATISVSSTLGSAPAASGFGVTNVGNGTLSYAITTNQGWLTVSPVSGNLGPAAGQQHTVTFAVPPGMQAGVSNATITVTDAAASNSPKTVAVQWTVNAITDPSAATVTADGKELVRLAWTKHASYDVMIVHRAGSAPSAPSQGTSYSVGDACGGGTVIYKGTAAYRDHVVPAGQTHHYT